MSRTRSAPPGPIGSVLLALLALPAAGPTAHAEPDAAVDRGEVSTTRVVTTRDGRSHTGRLIQLAPGKSVTLQLPSLEVRRFLWAEVERIDEAPAPAAAAPPPPPPPPPPPLAAAPPPPYDPDPPRRHRPPLGSSLVSLSGPAHVTLEWLPPEEYRERLGSDVREVCSLPCTRALTPEGAYRLTGPGVTTETLSLARFGPDPSLRVEPGASATYGGGVALLVVGPASLFVGSLLAIIDNLDFDICLGGSCSSRSGPPVAQKPMTIAGLSLIGIGLAATVAGAVLVVRGRTRIVPAGTRLSGLRLPLGRGVSLTSSGLAF